MKLSAFIAGETVTDSDIGPLGWKLQRGGTPETRLAVITKGLSWIRPTITAKAKKNPELFNPDADVKFERRPSKATGVMSTVLIIGEHVFSRDAYGKFVDESDADAVKAAAEKFAEKQKSKTETKEEPKAEEPKPADPVEDVEAALA
jgi:hypothetical protein